MEDLIETLLGYGCKRIDLFFMVGLPYQDYGSVMKTTEYCDDLLKGLGKSRATTPFISPLAPFVDPGSMVFESPEEHGYKLFFRDAESHRQAMEQPGWKYFLNYETQWMSRDEIVDSTYHASLALNKVKMAHGLISADAYRGLEKKIAYSLDTVGAIDRIMEMDPADRKRRVAELRIEVEKNVGATSEKKELGWPTGILRMNFCNILKTLAGR